MTSPAARPGPKRPDGFARRMGAAAWAVGLAGSLAGCTAYETVTDMLSDPIVLSCPPYSVLADAASLVKFRDGPGRDLVDVDYEGKITNVELVCISDIDKTTRAGTLETSITLRLEASRGPANRNRKARFGYFVRVIDRERNILWGENFTLDIDFPGNRTRVQVRGEPIVLEIPVQPNRSSGDYRILTGFKLTREQLRFNRSTNATTPR